MVTFIDAMLFRQYCVIRYTPILFENLVKLSSTENLPVVA